MQSNYKHSYYFHLQLRIFNLFYKLTYKDVQDRFSWKQTMKEI